VLSAVEGLTLEEDAPGRAHSRERRTGGDCLLAKCMDSPQKTDYCDESTSCRYVPEGRLSGKKTLRRPAPEF
jgi:hypothetical protein